MIPYYYMEYTKYNWFYLVKTVKTSKIEINIRSMSVSVLGKSGKDKGMTEERQVIEFVRRFHQTCLEQQDVEQIGQMLSDDIEWTGAGNLQ